MAHCLGSVVGRRLEWSTLQTSKELSTGEELIILENNSVFRQWFMT